MKIYNTQSEIEADIKNGELFVDDDLTITFDCTIDASINALNINARNIDALDIKAEDIKSRNINAGNINALNINADDIKAWNINALNINARNIDARNINALNINALNINARNIFYYAVCFAHYTFTCQKIEGKRENAKHFCLDSDIKILTGEKEC